MARRPKADTIPTPPRRGRTPKAVAATFAADASPDAAADTAATADEAAPAKNSVPTPAKRGRKPKRTNVAAALPPDPGEGAAAEASPAADGPPPDEGDDAMIAEMALPATSEASGDDSPPQRSGKGAATQAGDPRPPFPPVDAAAPAMPAQAASAARWDRASDAVSFDWPAIERTASQDGPNQAMAKLLVAARAEGANSRWPL